MKLRILSVTGGALNFGARRMEAIMRIAWLPVVLLLVFNMASVFATLSIANNRLITFADLAQGVSYNRVVLASQMALVEGLVNMSAPIWAVFLATLTINTILVAAFMAPLIRYAGLGERPAPGVVTLAFGADQVRYIVASAAGILFTVIFVYAPIGAAVYWVTGSVFDALSQLYVSFPNPESLHTIELVSAQDVLAGRGRLWAYLHGLPLAAAAFFGVLFWLLLNVHFHPKNRHAGAGTPNLPARALVTAAITAVLVSAVWIFIRAASGDLNASVAALMAIGGVIAVYSSLRLFPYCGVAVCRKSLAPAGLLHVTRGWNILRLLGVIILVSSLVVAVQLVINLYVFWFLGVTVNTLYTATLTATKLTNSGEAAAWVLPLFVWVWNGLKILVNLFLTFFTYGVSAGLQGRLYQESERGHLT